MKFGTIVKIGALAAAAASTAAGTVLVTTKAFAKVGKMPKEEPIDTSNGPIIKKPLAPADPVPAEPIKPYVAPTPVVEPVAAPAPVVEPVAAPIPEPTPAPAFVAPEPTPAPAFVTPEPAPMPVFTAPEPEPVTFANIPSEPVVAEPVAVELPDIPAPAPVIPEPVAAPIPEPTPAPAYTLDYALPYMAGNSDDKTIVTGGVEIPVEEPTPVIEEPAPVVGGSETSGGRLDDDALINQPLKSEVEDVVTPTVEAPVVEEPASAGLDLINSALAEEPAPVIEEPVVAEPVLPVVEEPVAEEPKIDLSSVIAPNPAAEQVAPVVEEPAPVVEPIAEPVVEEVAPVVEPIVEAAPVVEPVVEEPAPAPVTFGNLSSTEDYIETIAADEEPAPVVEAVPAADKGKEQKIGDAIVSDKANNPNIAAVAAKFGMNADNLVSIEAAGNMPMVFEFLYADMRNDATLVAVYFIMNGEATLPPETDKENVLAFGRNFITGNDELKAFLA